MKMIEVDGVRPEFTPTEWMPLLRKRIMWEVEIFVWSLPISVARLAEIGAEKSLQKSLQNGDYNG